MVPALAGALGMSEEQVQGFMAEQFPAMMQTMGVLPQMQEDGPVQTNADLQAAAAQFRRGATGARTRDRRIMSPLL